MINSLSELLYSHILIILLLGAGIFFTIKTKFVQIRMFIESLRVVAQPGSDKNGLSSFQALMVSTASRVGTGNIAGISTAICLGGSAQCSGCGLRLFSEAHLHLSKVRLLKFTNTKQRTGGSTERACILYSGRFEEALDRRPFRSCFDPDLYGRIQPCSFI